MINLSILTEENHKRTITLLVVSLADWPGVTLLYTTVGRYLRISVGPLEKIYIIIYE